MSWIVRAALNVAAFMFLAAVTMMAVALVAGTIVAMTTGH